MFNLNLVIMKKLFTLFFGFLLSTTLMAQGTIQSITISPASPTVTDDVKAYVSMSFTSGGCGVNNQTFYTMGNITDASALHCLGMLAYICSAVDTFDIGYLPAGNHLFRFTLSSGFGYPNCVAGIIPDDTASVNFMVSPATGMAEAGKQGVATVTVYPNPVSNLVMIKINEQIKLNSATLRITDSNGKTVKALEEISSNDIIIQRNGLLSGVYFYQLSEGEKIISSGRLVME